MKSSTNRIALAFTSASLLACGAARPPPMVASTTTTTSVTAYAAPVDEGHAAATKPSALDDEQVLASIRAGGRSILEQSRQAVKKGRSATVRELALELLDTYGQVAARLDAVARESGLAPTEGPMSDEVKRQGEELTIRLARSAGGGASFDRSYVEGQLAEATRLVDLTDGAESRTQNAQIQAFLGAIRARVAEGRRAAAGVHMEIAK